MEGFVTLLFIKIEGQNLADWGILICTFQKPIVKIEGFYDVITVVYKGLVPLMFLNVYFDLFFFKNFIYFQIQGLYDIIMMS